MPRPWNHNIHYEPVLLAAMPERRERALDVGCGEGALALRMRRSIRHVSAVDLDAASIEIARRSDPASEINFLLGDFLTSSFEPASFDFVVCVAALHHMDAQAAVRRMDEVLRPGGTLAVLGLARGGSPADLPRHLAATIVSRAHRLRSDHRRSRAPTSRAPTLWPPPHTYAEIQSLAQDTLPGSRFRRHLLWRYSITWTKPPG